MGFGAKARIIVDPNTKLSRLAEDIKRGDKVWCPRTRSFVVVRCVVESGGAKLYGGCMTKWHPVLLPDQTQWQFAWNTWEQFETVINVFDFILWDGHSLALLDANDEVFEAPTLGHGLTTDRVISHSFFGDMSVIERSLNRFVGWDKGHITLTSSNIVRNMKFGIVSGFIIDVQAYVKIN